MSLLEVTEFAKKLDYDSVKFLKKWKTYDVYEPLFNVGHSPTIGIPFVILVEGDNIRMSTVEESLEII